MEIFLGNYLPHVRREAKFEEFIDISHGNKGVEEHKLTKSTRFLNKVKPNKKGQPVFRKRSPYQNGASASNQKLGIGSGSQIINATCFACGKRHDGNVYPLLIIALVLVRMVIR